MILVPRLTWWLARDLIVVLLAGSMAVTQVIMLMIKIYGWFEWRFIAKIINGSYCQSCLKQLVSQDPGWARRPPMLMWGSGDFPFLFSRNYLFTKLSLSLLNNNKLSMSETRFGFHYRVDLVAGVVREGWVLIGLSKVLSIVNSRCCMK